jgi:hypothetical protein
MSLFKKISNQETPSLSVCSSGKEKRGKTFWALSAPGPVAVIASDPGTESAVRQWQRAGKDISCFFHVLPGTGQKIEVYEAAWAKVAAAFDEAIQSPSIRTIVIDTATEIWELLRLARFGRLTQVMPHHYGPVNAEFRSLFHRVAGRGKNSIWIHKVKKEYATNKEGKDSWTGRWERSGFGGFEYLVDLVVEHDLLVSDDGPPEFAVRVIDSRFHPTKVNGQVFTGAMCSFPALASAIMPEYDFSVWDDGVPSPAAD